MSRMADQWPVFGTVGSGLPRDVSPCQTSRATMGIAASKATSQIPRCFKGEGSMAPAGTRAAAEVVRSCRRVVCDISPTYANGENVLTARCYFVARGCPRGLDFQGPVC